MCDPDSRNESGRDQRPMINQPLSTDNLQAAPRVQGTPAQKLVETHRVGRLIQMTLAIYLTPVLLVVVVISGAGMMILGLSETIHGLGERGRRVTRGNGKPDFDR